MDKTVSGRKRSAPQKERSFFVSVFVSTAIALIFGFFLLILICLMGLSLKDPAQYTPMLAIAALFATSLLAGYLSARGHGKSGLACGALSALLLLGVLILLAFAFEMQIHIPLFGICAPAVIVCSSIAGIVGVGADRTPKKKHKTKY